MKTPLEYRNPKYNYDKIDENGRIQPGTIVYKNDVIIGKIEIFVNLSKNQQLYNDQSLIFQDDEGIVTQSVQNITKDGIQKITIKIKQYVYTQCGDKFAVTSGGCKSTVSKILDDHLIPYFEDGTQPDMIFNIHSVCTRRSLGLLFDGLINQYAIQEQTIVDGTPFLSGTQIWEQAKKALEKNGFNDAMLTERYDPYLLQPVGKVFRANFYYQCLQQKPRDKRYAVDLNCGCKSLFTRHNVSGKQKHGSIKFLGDQEKSTFLAQNASFMAQELAFKHCDGAEFWFCSQCLSEADKDLQSNTWTCLRCNGKSKCVQIQMTYALKQLQRIMRAIGLDLKFEAKKSVIQLIEDSKK